MKTKTKLLLGLGFASVAAIAIPTTVVLTSCSSEETNSNSTTTPAPTIDAKKFVVASKDGTSADTAKNGTASIIAMSGNNITITSSAKANAFFSVTLPDKLVEGAIANLDATKFPKDSAISYKITTTDTKGFALNGNVLTNSTAAAEGVQINLEATVKGTDTNSKVVNLIITFKLGA